MDKITTYSARRGNIFVWMSVLFMAASIVCRIIWLTQTGESGFWFVLFSAVFPFLGAFFIALRLPIRGEKYFYVTVRPVLLICIGYIYRIAVSGLFRAPGTLFFGICCLVIVLAQWFLYYFTFTGKIPTRIPVLLVFALPLIVTIFDIPEMYVGKPIYLCEALMVFGIICAVLAAQKLPKYKEGDAYRFRYGDRMDGRLVRGGIPLDKVAPYIMVNRNGASNFVQECVETSAMDEYIHKKRREGLKHFGITHVFIAAYVRACAEMPGLMRFLSGQKAYQRMGIILKMAVKKELKLNSPETIISVELDPHDNADDVYRKFNEQVELANGSADLDSSFDSLAKLLNFIPGVVLKFAIWLLRTLDYFGLLPPELLALSPFHGSAFITSMGSLGIPPIYHHLYDFGNIPVFLAFGAKRTVYEPNSAGEILKKKYVDFTAVTDERIVDGQYYASAFKKIRSCLLHPEQLDEHPEVKEDIY